MQKTIQIPAAIGVAILGVGAAVSLALAGRQAEADAPPASAPLVEVLTVALTDAPAQVQATGTVAADQQVTLSAQVTGQVVNLDPRLVPGGRFKEGEVLLRVDARDYRYAVQQAEAQVAQAQLELSLESGRGAVARQEWQMLGKAGEPPPLTARTPQLEAAKAGVASAQAALGTAQLNLERTSLRAPFNALVVSENVEKGQVLSPGAGAVSVVGTDRLRVTVSVPVEALAVLDVPGVNAEAGSQAMVTQRLGGGRVVEREGQLISLSGQLDAQTRTAQLVVAIEEPFASGPQHLPLLPGAFVDVTLTGRPLDGAMRVPREVVRDGDQVWVVGEGDKLELRTLEVAWRGQDVLWVSGGLKPGDRVVTTRLGLPIVGMGVRVDGGEE